MSVTWKTASLTKFIKTNNYNPSLKKKRIDPTLKTYAYFDQKKKDLCLYFINHYNLEKL